MVPRSAPHVFPRQGKGFSSFLDGIEKLGNRLPDPLLLFVLIAILIPIASWIVATAGWTLTHPSTGEPLLAQNLLTTPQLRRMLTESVSNFVNFPPLGVVLVALLGVGIAERGGLLAAVLRGLVNTLPRRAITAGVVLAGILSNVASDAGYVVLVPLAGVIFAGVGRHPVAGICAAFAGVSGGFSANLFISTLDPMLAGFSEAAAQLLDPGYKVNAASNYYFMAASTLLLVSAGTFITERIVEPRLGPWQSIDPAQESFGNGLTRVERTGLLAAAITTAVLLLIMASWVVPRNGFLRDENGGLGPFYRSIVPLMALLFLVPGLAFGIITGSIRSVRSASNMLAQTIGGMGSYIVLAFVAAQFIAYFSWSNLGLMIATGGAQLLKASGLPTALLIVGVVLVTAGVNLFIGSASAKYALMSPVLVPLMMELNLSPEMAQATYRVGDSITNIITPLMPYFPIIVAFAQKWDPNLRLGTFLASMLPYSITFLVAWTVLLLGWFWLDLPLGPDSPILYRR